MNTSERRKELLEFFGITAIAQALILAIYTAITATFTNVFGADAKQLMISIVTSKNFYTTITLIIVTIILTVYSKILLNIKKEVVNKLDDTNNLDKTFTIIFKITVIMGYLGYILFLIVWSVNLLTERVNNSTDIYWKLSFGKIIWLIIIWFILCILGMHIYKTIYMNTEICNDLGYIANILYQTSKNRYIIILLIFITIGILYFLYYITSHNNIIFQYLFRK